ncbi:5-formyltetrahydrofolate cyclo-ligase, mitochondrial-like isoform X2 [Mangifera indica]|uniref:5-formyltetrahydrofolate cyclo-ligase, mitochondrial-like isoform X2 n=1 Tax=Mangifera indica TaxID=29780 RepID=UPI001CFA21A5|nr:5-formyltetrahydrofolate cyclo-ligase, mitochondrial-like isoform X2 [Mangifera indica]
MSAITCYHRAPTQSTMNRHCKTTATVIRSVNELAIIPRLRGLSRSLLSSNVCTNAIMNKDAVDSHQLEALFQQKRLLRSKIRKDLKNMDPIQRSQEDNVIQNIVIESSWFKDSRNLCAYISCAALREVDTSRIVSEILSNPINAGSSQLRKKLYVPRVEDKNSNMKMLKISSVNDLIANSMNILEPPLTDADGNQCEDVMQAREPLDLVILPGLAFDKSGGRLGRSGGYYDVFLKKYQKLAQERKWKLPLLVALSYSVQIMEEGSIPVTPGDVPVDALVSPSGFIPTSPIALESCGLIRN